MSAALVRLNKNRRCATRNVDQPISGYILALVVALTLAAAFVLDMPRLVAWILA